jgi:hypothetical protein
MILYGRHNASVFGPIQLPADLHYKVRRSDILTRVKSMILIYQLATGADKAGNKRKDLDKSKPAPGSTVF